MKGRRPGRGAILASVVLHVALLAGVVVSAHATPDLPPMRVYRVDLYSPPPQAAGEPAPAVAAPEPTPAQPEPKPEPEPEKPKPTPAPPKAVEKPKPKPAETTPKPPATKPAEKPEPKPATGSRPDPNSPGGEDLNVKLEGEAFPYPAYLENIIRQVRRYFRWEGAPDLQAEIYFVIGRDGSIAGLRLLKSSGNSQFDLQALGAAEIAGKRGEFGPLPDGFQGDRLPVSFTIAPPGR